MLCIDQQCGVTLQKFEMPRLHMRYKDNHLINPPWKLHQNSTRLHHHYTVMSPVLNYTCCVHVSLGLSFFCEFMLASGVFSLLFL